MRLLLDTHVLVWVMTTPRRLSASAAAALRDPDNDLLVGVGSAYEIDFKREVSPDLALMPFDLDDARRIFDFDWLALTRSHTTRAARLPRIHRDPWDRLMIAQAIVEDLVIVSVDAQVARYGVPVLW